MLHCMCYYLSKLWKVKIYSFGSLPLEKTLTFHNVITLIKPVSNKNKNCYYHNIFLEKYSYKYDILW